MNSTLVLVTIALNLLCLSHCAKIVCYYASWAAYRTDQSKLEPKDMDPNLCTHLIYSFAILDQDTHKLKAHDSWLDLQKDGGFYKKLTELKNRNNKLKVLLAVGGWTDSNPGTKYSALVADANKRKAFIADAVEFLKRYGFDGLDLDWEYPKASDKENFATFVKELKDKFRGSGLLVTAAVATNRYQIDQSYDVAAIARELDQIHLMTYDFHGSWDKETGLHSALYPVNANDLLNVDSTVQYFIQKGAPANKLILGIPMYGRTWTLANNNQHGIGAPVKEPGHPGPVTKEKGTLAYFEICSKQWTIVQQHSGPYGYNGDQWVSFDDARIIEKKCQYIKQKKLGGAMVWALDQDDASGNYCHQGKYPLLSVIKKNL